MQCTMQGNTALLWRHIVEYEEKTILPNPDNFSELMEGIEQRTEIANSVEHLDAIIRMLEKRGITEYEITAVSQEGNEWIDGREFPDMAHLLKAHEMGEEAYINHMRENDLELQTALYLVELDFRLLLLEWGITR